MSHQVEAPHSGDSHVADSGRDESLSTAHNLSADVSREDVAALGRTTDDSSALSNFDTAESSLVITSGNDIGRALDAGTVGRPVPLDAATPEEVARNRGDVDDSTDSQIAALEDRIDALTAQLTTVTNTLEAIVPLLGGGAAPAEVSEPVDNTQQPEVSDNSDAPIGGDFAISPFDPLIKMGEGLTAAGQHFMAGSLDDIGNRYLDRAREVHRELHQGMSGQGKFDLLAGSGIGPNISISERLEELTEEEANGSLNTFEITQLNDIRSAMVAGQQLMQMGFAVFGHANNLRAGGVRRGVVPNDVTFDSQILFALF